MPKSFPCPDGPPIAHGKKRSVARAVISATMVIALWGWPLSPFLAQAQAQAQAQVQTQLRGPTDSELMAEIRCLRKVCIAIRSPGPGRAPVTCTLSRTWPRQEIQQALQDRIKLAWPLGDASCKVAIDVPARTFRQALSPGQQTFQVSPQPVSCTLQGGDTTYNIGFTLSPTLRLTDGRATDASIGIDNVKGPLAVRAILWSIAQLERAYNPFRRDIVQAVNTFLQDTCPH